MSEYIIYFFGLIIFFGVVFLVLLKFTGSKKTTLKPKPKLLIEAEALLAKGDSTLAVLKAFTGLEKCLQTIGSGTTFDLIELAKSKKIFDANLVSQAHQIRLLRNKITHDGSNLNSSQAASAVKQIRILISALGFKTS